MSKLKFPKNEGILDFPTQRELRTVDNIRGFSRIWLGFFNQIYKRLTSAEVVTTVSTADVGTAGAAYSQSYANEQTAMINELKAKVNELLATLKE